jgi:DNA-binding MarR family transcriptional regulator
MSIEFLSQLASASLPKSFSAAEDIDAIKILRQAGLVVTLEDESTKGSIRVLAVTRKGRDELVRFHYPENNQPRNLEFWLPQIAQRAREAIKRSVGV